MTDAADRSEPSPPSVASFREARPLFLPRGLVMLASAWVFASWTLVFGFRPPVQPQSASYGPGIQMLLLLVGLGIGVGWPLLRLSGPASRAPFAQSAIDGVSVLVLLQVVIWPLRLVTTWTLPRTIAVVAAAAAAIFLVAALLAIATRAARRPGRARWMAIFLALALLPGAAELACTWVTDEAGVARCASWIDAWLLPASAPGLLSHFSEPSTVDPSPSDRATLVTAIVISSTIWLASAAWAAVAARGRAPQS